jgi:hypothetical protein
VLAEAATLNVLHVHFSGGEPLVRRDLVELVGPCRCAGQMGLLASVFSQFFRIICKIAFVFTFSPTLLADSAAPRIEATFETEGRTAMPRRWSGSWPIGSANRRKRSLLIVADSASLRHGAAIPLARERRWVVQPVDDGLHLKSLWKDL